MDVNPLPLEGCFELVPRKLTDSRGYFLKTFHEETFESLGMDLPIAEQYLTKSSRHVIRGMHFQVPPRDHAKLVSCPVGAVFDVVVDLRKGSPTYGRHASIELNDQKGNLLYIPTGFAHGFCVISPEALMLYNVTTIHSPAHDRGLHWNSCGIEWPTSTPIISQRDSEHPPLDSYDSPFTFDSSRAETANVA